MDAAGAVVDDVRALRDAGARVNADRWEGVGCDGIDSAAGFRGECESNN